MKVIMNSMAIIIACTIISCGEANDKSVASVRLEDIKAKNGEIEKDFSTTTDSTVSSINSPDITLQSGKPAPAYDWNKKIIKTANVTLELKDYKSFNSTIHNTTRRFGAYISSEQQSEQDNKIENTISIKVPVDQFDDLMNSLPAEGVKVVEKRISSEEVTGEIVDTKARVEARKQVRERYLELLKRAKTMKEILEVQQEVNTVQEDIESGNGKVQFLNHQSAYSTINLSYFQYLTIPVDKDTDEPGFVTKLKEAFKDGSSVVGGVLIAIVTFWPLLLSGLVVWYFVKKRKISSPPLKN
ncbi:MAG TPA: DUF4349 domain-containing protein [Segetibacter sp.]|jgi:hypothetical protein